nr:hypothetical protein [Tanacetum cinerariifolium]
MRLPQPLPIETKERERRLTEYVLLQSVYGYVFQGPHSAMESVQLMFHERYAVDEDCPEATSVI